MRSFRLFTDRLFRRRQTDDEMREEFCFHLKARAADLERSGLRADEAYRRARVEFGSTVNYEEECREARVAHLLHQIAGDLRYAGRMLRNSRGFTTVTVLTLALGIGANTAIFTVVHAVLLQPLPFRDPGRLVLVKESVPNFSDQLLDVPAPDVLEYQAKTRSFEKVAGYRPDLYELSGSGSPESVLGLRSTSSLLAVLGVAPQWGRNFTADEDQRSEKVVLISYALWQRHFAGNPGALGRTLNLDRVPYTIIGIMPQGFEFPLPVTGRQTQRVDLWVPMSFTQHELEDYGDNFDYGVIGRLKPGLTPQQADEDVRGIAEQILASFPPKIRGDLTLIAATVPLREQVVGGARTLLLLLLGAVGCVLLIACANVANLLLARGAGRRREIAVRLALGATRTRLVAQMLVESLMLASLGALVGLLVAMRGTNVLVRIIPAGIPLVHAISVSVPVLLFAVALTLVTGVLFGLAPAIVSSRIRVNDALKEGGRGGDLRHRRLSSVVVVAEMAVAMSLLAGAGLLLRSFEHVRRTDPGFEPEHVLTASFRLPAVGTVRAVTTSYGNPAYVRNFYEKLLLQLAQLPGVTNVAASTDLPLETSWNHVFSIEGYTPAPGAQLNVCAHSVIFGDYFRTLGIPLLRGRTFEQEDYKDKEKIVIISESLARRFFPQQDPTGKRLKWGPPQSNSPWLTIVGVVGDVKQGRLDEQTWPHTYTPYPAAPWLGTVALRTSGDPVRLASAMRQAIWKLDPQLAIADVRSMQQVITSSTAARKSTMFLLVLFAASALLLAAVGIYGVISHAVAQRTHEIGIRVTLGADPLNVLTLVLRNGAMLSGAGVLVGGLASFGLMRYIKSLLFNVTPGDPLTLAVVALLLIAVALLASYVPARRATRVDPVVALRHD